MPAFSPKSLAQLATAVEPLQRLFNAVIADGHDCTVIIGHRDQPTQDECCRTGHSKTPWPTSKHNTSPSQAVDVMPCPIDWDDSSAHHYFASIVKAKAFDLGIKVRWGGTFKRFVDKPHWELV